MTPQKIILTEDQARWIDSIGYHCDFFGHIVTHLPYFFEKCEDGFYLMHRPRSITNQFPEAVDAIGHVYEREWADFIKNHPKNSAAEKLKQLVELAQQYVDLTGEDVDTLCSKLRCKNETE